MQRVFAAALAAHGIGLPSRSTARSRRAGRDRAVPERGRAGAVVARLRAAARPAGRSLAALRQPDRGVAAQAARGRRRRRAGQRREGHGASSGPGSGAWGPTPACSRSRTAAGCRPTTASRRARWWRSCCTTGTGPTASWCSTTCRSRACAARWPRPTSGRRRRSGCSPRPARSRTSARWPATSRRAPTARSSSRSRSTTGSARRAALRELRGRMLSRLVEE